MATPEQEASGAVSEATRDSDRRDSAKQGRADRMPTPEEEREADKLEVDDEVAANYKEAIEIGADVKGEGQID